MFRSISPAALLAPKTGDSLSCHHSFSSRFLPPGVNVWRRGGSFHANDSSGPLETLRNRAKEVREGHRAGVNAVRFPVSRRCACRASSSPVSHQTACEKIAYLGRTGARQGGHMTRKPAASKMRIDGSTKCVCAAHAGTAGSASLANAGDRACAVLRVTNGGRGALRLRRNGEPLADFMR